MNPSCRHISGLGRPRSCRLQARARPCRGRASHSAAIPPFLDGVQTGFRLDAALSLVGLVLSLLFVGGRLFVGAKPATSRPDGQLPVGE
jgi:hypothetical protein